MDASDYDLNVLASQNLMSPLKMFRASLNLADRFLIFPNLTSLSSIGLHLGHFVTISIKKITFSEM